MEGLDQVQTLGLQRWWNSGKTFCSVTIGQHVYNVSVENTASNKVLIISLGQKQRICCVGLLLVLLMRNGQVLLLFGAAQRLTKVFEY